MWKINEDEVTVNPNNPLEMYIKKDNANCLGNWGKHKLPPNYRKYSFYQIGHRGIYEKGDCFFEISRQLASEIYKEKTAIIYIPYSWYEYERKILKYSDIWKLIYKGVAEKLIQFLKKNKRKEILWVCYNAGKEEDTVVVLPEYIDWDYFDKIFEYCQGRGDMIYFRRYNHYGIQYKEDIDKTAKSYLYDTEFLIEIVLRKGMKQIEVIINTDYISFEKLIGIFEPILNKHEFVLTNRVDPYPPDCTGLSEEETAQKMQEWKDAREELTIYNRATLNILRRDEKEREEIELKRKKRKQEKVEAERIRLEKERIAKEKLAKGEPVGLDESISNLFNGFYEK